MAAGVEGLREGADPGPPAEGDLGHLSRDETTARGIAMLPRRAPPGIRTNVDRFPTA
ncbi:MAG: glutamine synthetase [Chloroflexota bacterium]|nr:glutamine synthetase [Chloroflexota bacterium]